MNELRMQSIEKLAPLLKDKQISPVELTESVLFQAKAENELLNAYINIYSSQALQDAKKAEKEILNNDYRGSLHGIPIGLKDNLYMKDKITTMGSKIHQNFKPEFDATVVQKLKKSGAILTGKLNMHEYALGITTNNPHYGPCRNPWERTRIPGGSSGGSAAAVSNHMATAALGTDTGGSIRIPASACGIVGLKPTYGRVSKHGCFPEAWTLDHVGPMTKTVQDAYTLLQAIEGFDKIDPMSLEISNTYTFKSGSKSANKIVIGINESFYFNNVDFKIESLIKEKIAMLEGLGINFEMVEIPTLKYCEYALTITDMAEASTVHHDNLLSRPQDFGKDIRPILELGKAPSAVDYLQAQQIRYKLNEEFDNVFERVDAIISPTIPIVPPEIGEDKAFINEEEVDLFDNMLRLTSPSNFTGHPALSLPIGFVSEMPVGVQLIGGKLKDKELLNLGKIIENTVAFNK